MPLTSFSPLLLTGVAGAYEGGLGTEEEPFIIGKPIHILQLVNSPADWGKLFQVTSPDVFNALILSLGLQHNSSAMQRFEEYASIDRDLESKLLHGLGQTVVSGAVIVQIYREIVKGERAVAGARHSPSADPMVMSGAKSLAGRIQGTVTGLGDIPLAGIQVVPYRLGMFSLWWAGEAVFTDASGNYELEVNNAGTYRVEFSDPTGVHAVQYYNNKSTLNDADTISVNDGQIISGWDAPMVLAGRIQGSVTDQDHMPLSGIQITAYQQGGYYKKTVVTDSAGNYDIGGLNSGIYHVKFEDQTQQHAFQYYSAKSSSSTADAVSVISGQITSGINAALLPAGRIQGRVTDNQRVPLQNILVNLWQTSGNHQVTVGTDADGRYVVGGLAPGLYSIGFHDQTLNYSDQYFYDISVVEGGATDLDVTLLLLGHIRGRVTGPGGLPLPNIQVSTHRPTILGSPYLTVSYTDAQGYYDTGGLNAGAYPVEFRDPSGQYAHQYYNNKPNLNQADSVAVGDEQHAENIDAAMTVAGRIQGRVTGPAGALLAHIRVTASQQDSFYYVQAYTDANGDYDIGGLGSGIYYVSFNDESAQYAPRYDINVIVTAGLVTSPIDASLLLYGRIQGRVSDLNQKPLANAQVTILHKRNFFGWTWFHLRTVVTDNEGNYDSGALSAQSYRVEFVDLLGKHASQYYNNKQTIELADDVVVSDGQNTTGVDASLRRSGIGPGILMLLLE